MSKRPRSQGVRKGNLTNDADLIPLAEKAVFWILAHGAHDTPIRHSDIKKHLFPDTRVEEPLKLVCEMLNHTFGYNLVELPTKTKMYVLINTIKTQEHVTVDKITEANHTLLSLVLGYIFMNRQPVEEAQLLRFLRNLEINIDETHPYFGNVSDLIFKPNAIFVKDQYLDVVNDEHGTFYRLGERFKREINPRELLKSVSKMCNEEPSVWKAQLKDIEEMTADPDG